MNHESSQMFNFDPNALEESSEFVPHEIEFVSQGSKNGKKIHSQDKRPSPPPVPQDSVTKQKPTSGPSFSQRLVEWGTQLFVRVTSFCSSVGPNRIVLFMALAQFLFVYFFTYFLQHVYIGQIFWQRTFVAPVISFICLLALNSIARRWFLLFREETVINRDFLPRSISDEISRSNAKQFIEHIEKSTELSNTVLKNRLSKTLHVIDNNRDRRDLLKSVETQSDRDFNEMNSSLASLNLAVWALPILGFVGTVLGISSSVGGFSGAVNSSADIEAVKNSLNGVTGGLATSFDTTLLALLASLLVMLPKTLLRRRYEQLLSNVDHYCEENLLQRVKDEIQPSALDPEGTVKAFDQILNKYQESWEKRTENISVQISKELTKQCGLMIESVVDKFDVSQREHRQMLNSIQSSFELTNEQNKQLAASLDELKRSTVSDFESCVHKLTLASETIERQLTGIQPNCEEASKSLQTLVAGQSAFLETSTEQFKTLMESFSESVDVIQTEKGVDHDSALPEKTLDQIEAMNGNSLLTVKFLSKINAKLKEQNYRLEQLNESHTPRKSWFQMLLGSNGESQQESAVENGRFR